MGNSSPEPAFGMVRELDRLAASGLVRAGSALCDLAAGFLLVLVLVLG